MYRRESPNGGNPLWASISGDREKMKNQKSEDSKDGDSISQLREDKQYMKDFSKQKLFEIVLQQLKRCSELEAENKELRDKVESLEGEKEVMKDEIGDLQDQKSDLMAAAQASIAPISQGFERKHRVAGGVRR